MHAIDGSRDLERQFPPAGTAPGTLELAVTVMHFVSVWPGTMSVTWKRAVPPSSPTAGHDVELPSAKILGAARGRDRVKVVDRDEMTGICRP